MSNRGLISALILSVPVLLHAQPRAEPPETAPKGTDQDANLKVAQACAGRIVFSGCSTEVGLNDTLTMQVTGLNQVSKDFDVTSLRLFLDRCELPHSQPSCYDLSKNLISFTLTRSTDSRDAWNHLLGSPSQWKREVRVGVGRAGKTELAPVGPNPTITLIIVHRGRFTLFGLFIIAALILFLKLAKKSDIIRDSGPPDPPPDKRRPYSLARTQMSFWFFLILSSFILLWAITGDHDTITEQALVLMGIGTGTALGAATIDASKQASANETLDITRPALAKAQTELAALAAAGPAAAAAEKQAQVAVLQQKVADAQALLHKPVSEGLRTDLLTDANGISFHRFQIVIWTLALGWVFVDGVYHDLTMPQFSNTLLALMGISAGTYLGFKIPERQT